MLPNRQRFYEAFVHVSHRVMGRKLQPFTLRHRLWLEAMDSPLVTGGRATLMDLELASVVCSIPFRDLDRRMPVLLARGPGPWTRLSFLWRFWRRAAAREYAGFQEYFIDHGCPPSTHGGSSATKDGKIYESLPGLLGLVTALARGSGWEPETIWGLSPGAAEWYLAGIFTHRGADMKIKSEHDEEFEEGMRREREAKGEGGS